MQVHFIFNFIYYFIYYFYLIFIFQKTNLVNSKNWSNVVDFRWHRSTPSPNWKILQPNERIRTIEGIEGLRIKESINNGDDNLSTERNDEISDIKVNSNDNNNNNSNSNIVSVVVDGDKCDENDDEIQLSNSSKIKIIKVIISF